MVQIFQGKDLICFSFRFTVFFRHIQYNHYAGYFYLNPSVLCWLDSAHIIPSFLLLIYIEIGCGAFLGRAHPAIQTVCSLLLKFLEHVSPK